MDVSQDASIRFQGVDKSSTAYKLLASMGWQEGQGLGAQKQGIATHVRVKRKADASGVGATQELAKAKDWTLGMAAYDSVLAALKNVSPEGNVAASKDHKKSKKKKAKKIAADECQNQSLPNAHKLPVEPEDAQLVQPAQKKAKRDTPRASNDDSPESEEVRPKKRLVTHAGRFQKVARNKFVKNYSATDLAAILGASKHEEKQLQPLLRIVKEADIPLETEALAAANMAPDGLSESSDAAETGSVWWQGHFVKAGRSGSGHASFSTSKRDVNVAGFSESDQANLWQNATDGQSKSKQGLGQGSALKVPAKERWQGKKTKIDDSDDDDSTASEPCQFREEDSLKAALILPPKRQQEAKPCQDQETRQAEDQAAPETNGRSVLGKPMKWRKIARGVLGSVEGMSLPQKAFMSKAWKAACLKGATDKKGCMRELLALLQQSKQFVIEDGRVRLATP